MHNVINKVNKIKLNFIEEQKKKYQKQIEKLNIMQEKIINKKKKQICFENTNFLEIILYKK